MDKSVVYEFSFNSDPLLDYSSTYAKAASIVDEVFNSNNPSLKSVNPNNYHIELERLGATTTLASPSHEGKSYIVYYVKVMGFLLEETERYVESSISHNGEKLYRKIKREMI